MKLIAAAAGGLLLAASFAQEAPPDAADELRRADEAFFRETRERGLEGWLAWFAPDATVFPPQGKLVTGGDALREYYSAQAFPPAGFRWTPDAAGLARSGDLGWSAGTFEIDGASGTAGRYLTVWRKEADGAWKVVADCDGAPDWRTRAPALDAPPQLMETSAEIIGASSAGDLVFHCGLSEARGISASSQRILRKGKYLAVWAREADGGWKVAAEIGFTDEETR